MKGLVRGIFVVLLFVQTAFSGAPITTNSFVRHDIGFSAAPLDFAVGAWNANGDAMIAAVTKTFNFPSTNAPETKLEIVAIGANSETNGPAAVYSAPDATGPISIGDIDGDGVNDVAYGAGTNVVVRLNTSSAFPAFDTTANFEVGVSSIPHGLALVDIDGDGKLDIVYATSEIYTLRNQSTAGAISFAPPITIYTNSASFQIGDLDGDGRPDLQVDPSGPALNSFLRNTSSPGAISFVESYAGSTAGYLVDVNADAKPDSLSVVTVLFSPLGGEPSTSLRISTNSSTTGTIAFARGLSVEINTLAVALPTKFRATLPMFRPDFAGGDFNQDGQMDLVWATATNRLVFLENLNLSPSYLMAWGSGIEVESLSNPYQPTVADMNHDGKPDVVVGSNSRFVSILENRIEPTPEILVIVDGPQSTVDIGTVVNLRAIAYAANVTAVDFFEDGRPVATANGLTSTYQPSSAGLHSITARATAGANSGLLSKATGLRVRDTKVGEVIGFGSGVMSQTTFLIYNGGRAFGAGSNARGQLADPFYDAPHAGFVEIPLPMDGGGWKNLSAGLGFTIGLSTYGRVYSWGVNDHGQLGRASDIITNPVPGEITFAAPILKIAAGSDFTLALDIQGELFAWGANTYGQLGTGDTAPRSSPRKIRKPEGVQSWRDVSVGQGHALALADGTHLFGWGWNAWGQTGQPRTNIAVLTPALIDVPAGETQWTNINAGIVASYAQTISGRTYRWGEYLTDAGEVADHVPALLEASAGSGGFRMVGAGAPLNVALGYDGNAYVWGGGILAPTGLGDQMTVSNPTRLPLPDMVNSWTGIAVAGRRAAIQTWDGRVFVWGTDFNYALGTGTQIANVPTEPCLPFGSCPSNYPPAVKIVHPAYGDIFPADRVFRFEIAANDFDGVIDFVKIIQEDTVLSGGRFPAIKQTEVARFRFGETTADIPVPKLTSAGTTFIPIAYDNSGLVRTGAAFHPILPPLTLASLTLTNTAPINPLTGWREAFASIHNISSFSFGSVLAIISNIPPGVVIRNNTAPTAPGVETITDPYGLAPGESTVFRIEYKLTDDVTGAQILARLVPGAVVGIGASSGEVQPLAMTILTNGVRMLEFDHAVGEQHVVQFSETLTNWMDAGGFMEERDGKMLWLDGGAPATSKFPTQTQRRFYRVLRKF